MQISDQVCSLELSIALQNKGVKQNGVWSWCKSIGSPWNTRPEGEWCIQLDSPEENDPNSTESYSAFTVAELGELLPQQLDWMATRNPRDKGKAYDLMIQNPRSSIEGWEVSYVWWKGGKEANTYVIESGSIRYGQKLADAMASMLNWLIDRGIKELSS